MRSRTGNPGWIAVLLALCVCGPARADIPDFMANFHRMVQQAYANSGEYMKYADSKGAALTPMADGNGLYLLWKGVPAPKYVDKMMVILPDADSDAYKEFHYWHPVAEKYGYALLIPQWADEATPSQVYATTVAPQLIANGVLRGGAVLYGRGKTAGFVYGIAALDHRDGGRQYFGTLVADDGAADFNEPVIQLINGGGLGRRVFDKSEWALYCSTDCREMERTAAWILFHAGEVGLFIEEPEKKGHALRDDPELLQKRLEPFLQGRGK